MGKVVNRVRKHKKGKKKKAPKASKIIDRSVSKSFVLKSGKVGSAVIELKNNVRKALEPNTAARLQEKSSNSLKDFLSMAGPLGISHFLIFSATDFGCYLRIPRVPRGPTIYFKITSFTTSADIVRLMRHPHVTTGAEYLTSPLLVLNNFPKDENHALAASMLQGLFPPLNIQQMKLKECKRIILFSYDEETESIEFRHYYVKVVPVGFNKNLKKVARKKIPNMGKYADISDFVLGNHDGSDSEVDDIPESKVSLPVDQFDNSINKDTNKKKEKTARVMQTAIRLTEIGPRMTMQLYKIEDDACKGKVMYNRFVEKTPEQLKQIEKNKLERARLKSKRKAEQQRNVNNKRKKINNNNKNGKDEVANDEDENDVNYEDFNDFDNFEDAISKLDKKNEDKKEEEMEDIEWYRKEVGKDPEPDEMRSLKTRAEQTRKKFNPLYKNKNKKSEDGEGEGEGEGFEAEDQKKRKFEGDSKKPNKKFSKKY